MLSAIHTSLRARLAILALVVGSSWLPAQSAEPRYGGTAPAVQQPTAAEVPQIEACTHLPLHEFYRSSAEDSDRQLTSSRAANSVFAVKVSQPAVSSLGTYYRQTRLAANHRLCDRARHERSGVFVV